MEDLTITKLGIIGVILVLAGRTIYALWSYGERKADAALKERDALRDERERLRLAHDAEKATLVRAYEQELARVRLEAQQQTNDVRAHTADRMDELLVEVTKFTSAMEPMLAKLFERVQRGR